MTPTVIYADRRAKLEVVTDLSGDEQIYELRVDDDLLEELEFSSFGPRPDGWTNEALIAVVIDRIGKLNVGEWTSLENDAALYHLRLALAELETREHRVSGHVVPLTPTDDQDERERQLRREPEPLAEDDPAQPSAGRTFL